jgi:enamine deaminase RidA (YjgF/YER057c/UK114 family)
MTITTLQLAEWSRPRGFSNGISIDGPGKLIVLAGQIGSNDAGEVDSDAFGDQCRRSFANIVRLLKEAGAGPEHLVRLTWFVTSKPDYLASGREIGAAYRDTIGKNFPTMTVIFVSALIDDRAKIEIEATAFVPEAK